MTQSTEQKPIRAGVFTTVERADEAVRRLIDAGFTREQITVVCSDESVERHFGRFRPEPEVTETDQPVVGRYGVIGGLLGGLISLAGVATTGGIGITAVGPILAGGVTGTLVGLLIGSGIENELARFYDQAVTEGHILVAVDIHADGGQKQADRLAEAAHLLEESGAEPCELEEG